MRDAGCGTRLWALAPARSGAVHVSTAPTLELAAEAALAAIVKEWGEHPDMTTDHDGTTDGVGRLDYNLRLSQRRVQAVTRGLTSNIVDRSRVVGAKRRAAHALKDDVKRHVVVKFATSAE